MNNEIVNQITQITNKNLFQFSGFRLSHNSYTQTFTQKQPKNCRT